MGHGVAGWLTCDGVTGCRRSLGSDPASLVVRPRAASWVESQLQQKAGQVAEGAPLFIAALQQLLMDVARHGDRDAAWVAECHAKAGAGVGHDGWSWLHS